MTGSAGPAGASGASRHPGDPEGPAPVGTPPGAPRIPQDSVRLRLSVSYDGTDFSGWAHQPTRRTVAGVLLGELTRVFRTVDNLTVAGRTDAGVHATGQVCHVDVPAAAWEALAPSIVRRLAGLLPGDVRVLAVEVAPEHFDARFAALRRRYEYRVCDGPSGPAPLARRNTLGWPRPLDLEALSAASRGLLGEHDFAAYCKRRDGATTIRNLLRLDWRRDPDEVLVATVEADAFCHSMVRSLIGALIAVGEGRRPVGWPGEQLTSAVRVDAVGVAPAHGLTLVNVDYPAPGEYLARMAVTRNMRALTPQPPEVHAGPPAP
ncbi:tRNA pseudouridine(38-40) synthase TruA [Longispora fulva]|uniref:tRNA pseudouridine synthase A n=2 Tax=Longispora fulva TaxID=619741 RepID=A0A8J7GLX1_9ACTN|nr:tRNA pseudouridine(38-40) synthase TruA [Longispora fulva]MBG6140110.1 tRNA pseudouridine38-40 synthase [Longispora fulva]